jgi:hypothetical protein
VAGTTAPSRATLTPKKISKVVARRRISNSDGRDNPRRYGGSPGQRREVTLTDAWDPRRMRADEFDCERWVQVGARCAVALTFNGKIS